MSIRKYSKKSIENRNSKMEATKLRFALFEKHWQVKPHYCESCDCKLMGDNKSYYHDHLLERSKRPDLELIIENLFLVCAECHAKKTNGFPTVKHQIAIMTALDRFSGNIEKENIFYE